MKYLKKGREGSEAMISLSGPIRERELFNSQKLEIFANVFLTGEN
jgi:hypothetical protein